MAAAGPAEASTAWGAASVCGSGYWPLDQHSLGISTVYLAYNGSTDCVVNWLDTAHEGQRTFLGADVETAALRQDDYDFYYHYAGPVRLNAPGQCIYWGGMVGTDANHLSGNWQSGASHCN
ncbi:serine/threonine protein kinase [Nocardia stercoris]|uniref:Serine/threonine protein kinase n=1 Tax=Nocardia stercoris TaxID=2483361 RepID=A0A3M2KRB6_9NOCA|nr:serine/threonine protein kinase [Nocardia stercoris]